MAKLKRTPQNYTIGIFGEIGAETLEKFMSSWSQILDIYQSGDKIEILISSPGGDLDIGIGLYEHLRTSEVPVSTKGIGMVGSTAVLLFSAGTTRTLSEGSYIFIHEGSAEASGSIRTLESYSAHNQIVHQWYCRQIAERSKASLQQILEFASAETFLDAARCLKLGLTDTVQYYSGKVVKK